MSPGQLTMHGVDITDLYGQVYEHIVVNEDDSNAFENYMDEDGNFEKHIFATLIKLEIGLFGVAECTFLQGDESIYGNYETIKKCVEIQYSQSLEVYYKQLMFFATFVDFKSSGESGIIEVIVMDANNEEFTLDLRDVHVSM